MSRNWQYTVFAVLAVALFYQWGERRLLESRFEAYVFETHRNRARQECSAEARRRHEVTIPTWQYAGISYGAGSDDSFTAYFRPGDHWNMGDMAIWWRHYLSLRWFVCKYKLSGEAEVTWVVGRP